MSDKGRHLPIHNIWPRWVVSGSVKFDYGEFLHPREIIKRCVPGRLRNCYRDSSCKRIGMSCRGHKANPKCNMWIQVVVPVKLSRRGICRKRPLLATHPKLEVAPVMTMRWATPHDVRPASPYVGPSYSTAYCHKPSLPLSKYFSDGGFLESESPVMKGLDIHCINILKFYLLKFNILKWNNWYLIY